MQEYVSISALQHYMYCPRQCALIHVEKAWQENSFTVQGKIFHAQVDEKSGRKQPNRETSVPLSSTRLRLYGIADVIEFHVNSTGEETPFPVEYKRGKSKTDDCDRVQLCAQALCLGEMLGISITQGALFYGKPRRKEKVDFTPQLITKTEEITQRIHELLQSKKTPIAQKSKKCAHCSLAELCMPTLQNKSARAYIQRELHLEETS